MPPKAKHRPFTIRATSINYHSVPHSLTLLGQVTEPTRQGYRSIYCRLTVEEARQLRDQLDRTIARIVEDQG